MTIKWGCCASFDAENQHNVGVESSKTSKKVPTAQTPSQKKRVKTVKVCSMDTNTLHEVVLANIAKGSTIYTDDYLGYQGLDNQGYKHELVKHSVKKFVSGMALYELHRKLPFMVNVWISRRLSRNLRQALQRFIIKFSNRNKVQQIDIKDRISSTKDDLSGKRTSVHLF